MLLQSVNQLLEMYKQKQKQSVEAKTDAGVKQSRKAVAREVLERRTAVKEMPGRRTLVKEMLERRTVVRVIRQTTAASQNNLV